MESINFIKGYDKVIPSEEAPNSTQNNPRLSKRRQIIIISASVFLLLVMVSLIGALVLESSSPGKSKQASTLASNSAEVLKSVCSVTLYPDLCFSSISPLNTPPINTPLRFFNLSLQASIIQISTLKTLINDSKAAEALKDCSELFTDARSQLENSAGLMRVGPGEKILTHMKISDIQTWISAAITHQETCIDGLEEMGSTVGLNEVKMRVRKSQEYMSNTLAILNNIQSLCDKFGLKLP